MIGAKAGFKVRIGVRARDPAFDSGLGYVWVTVMVNVTVKFGLG